MARQASKFKVGLFVIAGVLIALSALVYLGARTYFQGASAYVAFFQESVQGLQVDSVVKYRGVEVGRVRTIKVAPDNTLIEVVMDIQFRGPIGDDMVAQLKMVGITGIAYVELDRKPPGEPDRSPKITFPAEYPVIASRPSDISQLFGLVEDVVRQIKQIDFKALADQAQSALAAGRDLFKNERLLSALAHAEKATANLESVTAKADKFMGRGGLEDMIGEAKTAASEARRLMEETRAQVAGLKLADTGQKAHELVEEVKDNATGLTGDLRVTVENLRRTSETMERLLTRLERSPSDVLFSQPPTPNQRNAGGDR